jgi:hypothetical protein
VARRPVNSTVMRLHMDDSVRQHRAILDEALRRLQPHITSGRIIGSDASQFLAVKRHDRGAEIYGDGQSGFIIDPSLGEQLLGEVTYPTVDLALDAAVRWLNRCTLDELRPPTTNVA